MQGWVVYEDIKNCPPHFNMCDFETSFKLNNIHQSNQRATNKITHFYSLSNVSARRSLKTEPCILNTLKITSMHIGNNIFSSSALPRKKYCIRTMKWYVNEGRKGNRESSPSPTMGSHNIRKQRMNGSRIHDPLKGYMKIVRHIAFLSDEKF